MGWLLLYAGGALATALALLAVARQSEARAAVRQEGVLRASWYAVLLSLLWLPVFVYFSARPLVRKRPRVR